MLALLFPVSVFLFIAFSLKGVFPLKAPNLNLISIFNIDNYMFKEYNIRYGLNVFHFFIFLIGILSALSIYNKILILY